MAFIRAKQLFLILLGLSISTIVFAIPKKPLSAVADLRYGVALYHYYQSEHLEALSDLLVARERGGIQGHGDNPEIMEGGFYLAYGLERHASEIFERLLDENRPQKTRDAAWFYLARLRYMRNDWEGTEQALSKISEKPEKLLAHDIVALRINLLLKQDKPDEAEVLYHKSLGKTEWGPYIFYNLGSAFSRVEKFDKAITYFSKLAKIRQRSPEFLGLYDKAMTAAGYAHIFSQRPAEATEYFSRVRLNSPLSNRALLGYGWAFFEQEQYKDALMPWQELAKRPVIDEFTQEVLIAIPNTFEKLERYNLALQHYQKAEANFEAELVTLDLVLSELKQKDLLEALKIDRALDVNWMNYAEKNSLSPQLSYLVVLFSREEFLALVQELRDLLALQTALFEWEAKMQFYAQMLDERNANRKREMDFVEQGNFKAKIKLLQRLRDERRATLTKITTNSDFLALLEGDEREKRERIDRALKNSELLEGTNEITDEQLEILRFVNGVQIWSAQEDYADRRWALESSIIEIDRKIEAATKTETRIQKIIDEGFDLQPYRKDIATAEVRIAEQQALIGAAVYEAQRRLRDQVETVLYLQKRRLNHYLAKSRIAIARMMDPDVKGAGE